jgi:phosphatidylglycerophosphatase A
MKFRDNVVILLATGCYLGKIPVAPGTAGSLLGILGCLVLSKIQLSLAVLAAVIFIFLAMRIAADAENILKETDPGCIVIDEIAGMMIVFQGLPFNWSTVAVGFIFFRILDILKPFPIGRLERRFSGGVGVVIDDVAAGIIANIALRFALIIKDRI